MSWFKAHWGKITGTLIAIGLGSYLIASGHLIEGVKVIVGASKSVEEIVPVPEQAKELLHAIEPGVTEGK